MKLQSTHLMIGSSLVLYVASLFLPAFDCGKYESFQGYYVLLIGWFGFLALDPRWLTNFLLMFMWLNLAAGLRRPAFFLPVITTLFAASTIFIPALGCVVGGGAPGPSQGLSVGGYAWVISIILTSIAYRIKSKTGEFHASHKG
jgi:hypothetical protein